MTEMLLRGLGATKKMISISDNGIRMKVCVQRIHGQSTFQSLYAYLMEIHRQMGHYLGEGAGLE